MRDTWELATGEGFEWQLDIDTPEVSVWSCDYGQNRRVLKSEGLVHVSPSVLFHMLHENMAAQSSWNPIINRYEVVEKVDRYTDLTYTVTSAHAGGMVSPHPLLLSSVRASLLPLLVLCPFARLLTFWAWADALTRWTHRFRRGILSVSDSG